MAPSTTNTFVGNEAISRRQISDNFTIAKFLAIVLVSTGHYFNGSFLWAPVTVGLFVFAFSSGYFTALKHPTNAPLKDFWLAKLKRLGPPLIVINLFLALLFLVQGHEGIWHPHTLIGMTGMTGLLNWFGIPNQSPFGAGLWFMTVLLIFYLIYPQLARCLESTRAALIFIAISALVCTLGHLYVSQPYMLWPTIFGFCLGVMGGHIDWQPSAKYAMAIGATTLITLLGLNAIGLKQFNMLAIYLIHGYLFVRPSAWPDWAGYLASMIIILIASVTLHYMAQLISRRLLTTVK